MTEQQHNPIFEQWLMAYGNHLERLAQEAGACGDDDRTRPPASSPANDWETKER